VTGGAPPAEGGFVLGVDVGGTKLFGVVLDQEGSVVAEARAGTPQVGSHRASNLASREPPGRAIVEAVGGLVLQLITHIEHPDARAPLGVGVPGMLDRDGVLRFSPHLPDAVGADLKSLLGEQLRGCAPVVENDANCAALAEHTFGAARGVQEALVVTLGTGIGGGLIEEGRVTLGAHGFAGEIGHMLIDTSGPPCPCGRNGCWETYASGGGLGRLAREAAYAGRLNEVVVLAGGDPEDVRGEHVTRAAQDGDVGAMGVMRKLGWWLALGLVNVTAVLDPELIVLGGGLAEAGECLLEPTRGCFGDLVEGGSSRPQVKIVPAALGERAGAIGAALMARTNPMGVK